VPQNWQRIYEIFSAVQGLPPEQRHTEAVRLCETDQDLAREVLALLGGYDKATAENFLCVADSNAATKAVLPKEPPAPALVGSNLGPYRVLELLGAGGMGEVFLAERVAPFRMTVAIKVLRAGMLNEMARRRFVREQQALADLHHPGIVRLLDAGETDDGRPYFVMEYIDGATLAQAARNKPLSSDDAACLALEIAEAVAYVHKKGFLHRDLKPQNVLLDAQGRLRITDFGVAKTMQADLSLTRTGDLLGTPSYMSPEQAEGRRQDIGPATDIYGLGAILYFLLTGRPPFMGSNPRETIRQVVDTPLASVRTTRPGLDPRLEELCLRCLEKEPAQRPGSAREVANALRSILGPAYASPSASSPSLDLQALLDTPPKAPADPGENGAPTGKPDVAIRAPVASAAKAEEMEKTALWEPCVYCGTSTPERQELRFSNFPRNVLILLGAALALACLLCMLAWFTVGGAFVLIAGNLLLLLMIRYSASQIKSAAASVPCCGKHPRHWLEDLGVGACLIGLLACPLLAMLIAGLFLDFKYTWTNSWPYIVLLTAGSVGLVAASAWRHVGAVHTLDITSEKLHLTGSPRGDLELKPTSGEGDRLYPAEPEMRRWDASAFFIVIVMTVIACVWLRGDGGQNPFTLVALSSLLAAPVLALFPHVVRRWYGYPALLIPFVFATLALAFFQLAK
jgi:serine/threonine protein kinase